MSQFHPDNFEWLYRVEFPLICANFSLELVISFNSPITIQGSFEDLFKYEI